MENKEPILICTHATLRFACEGLDSFRPLEKRMAEYIIYLKEEKRKRSTFGRREHKEKKREPHGEKIKNFSHEDRRALNLLISFSLC